MSPVWLTRLNVLILTRCGKMGREGELVAKLNQKQPRKQIFYQSKVNITPPFLHTHASHQVYMALTVDHLRIVRAELFKACTKWYDIGLELKVPVNILDSIEGQFGNHSDKLRETLQIWLKTATEPSWQDVVGVLKSPVVGEPKLASDIESKYCTTAETAQASGPMMPEVQQPHLTTRGTELHTLQQALQDSRELRIKDQQLQDSRRHIHTLQQELQTKDQQLQDSQRHIHTLQQELRNDELTHQVEERTQTIEELQADNDRLRQELQQAVNPFAKWQESKAPENMLRGSVASDYNMAYFSNRGSTTVLRYDFDTQEWCRLSDAPHKYFTLVVIHHILTMVGGKLRSGEATDSLLSFTGEGRGKKWLPLFPAMPTKRFWAAVVCSGHSLIVAGGREGDIRLSTVEVLDTDTRQWSIASSLTHPFSLATISICGERLYMLGGGDQMGRGTPSVLSCSIPELLQSCQTQPLAGKLRTAQTNRFTIWRQVADAPQYYSSCATLCGQLVAVGGLDEADMCTNAITVYNERTDSWKTMEHIPTARFLELVVIVNGKMMVVGGWGVGGGWN